MVFEAAATLARCKREVVATVFDQIEKRYPFIASLGNIFIEQNPRFGGFAYLNPQIVDMEWEKREL